MKDLLVRVGLWIPVLGIFIFTVSFFWASQLYVGGNRFDPTHAFSFVHNFWCDLLDMDTHSGAKNNARPIGVFATLELCLTMVIFWILLPELFLAKRVTSHIIRGFGCLAMISAMFIFTHLHDTAINIASFLGSIAFICSLFEMKRNGLSSLFWLGAGWIVIAAINFIIWKDGSSLWLLPSLQKITLFAYFGWAIASMTALRHRNFS